MPRRSPLITVMANAAYKAAKRLVRDFGEVEQLQVSRKGPADFVSSADHKAEASLVEDLTRSRPKFGFLLEEGGVIKGEDSSNRWIIDPLDGTTNFLHGIPHFSISIGLERDSKMYAGVIYDPLRDELSSRRNMADAVIATGMPFKGRASHPEYPAMLDQVAAETSGVRRFGSAALDLAYVAAGRFDGFWEFALSPWDIAAGLVVLREAGGLVTEVDGGDQMMTSGDILATNGELHNSLRELLAKAADSSAK
jgi:myo-inositol-1(or 4)-monophosphatase